MLLLKTAFTALLTVLCHALQAQALLQQLERRQLYKYVSEVTLDVNAQQRYTAGGKPTADEIVSYQSSAQTGVSACCLICNATARAYGCIETVMTSLCVRFK
jgi:hypothetical protein